MLLSLPLISFYLYETSLFSLFSLLKIKIFVISSRLLYYLGKRIFHSFSFCLIPGQTIEYEEGERDIFSHHVQ